jgi:hypothetical protein
MEIDEGRKTLEKCTEIQRKVFGGISFERFGRNGKI